MKLSLLSVALLASTAAAFAPATSSSRNTVALNAVDRRSALGEMAFVTAAAVGMPAMASADGAVSFATKTKAKVVYGGRIADLKDAVEKGDFGAVAEEKNAFILFNSGVYPSAKDKASKATAVEGTNAIFAALKSKDAGALKTAYSKYVADNDISAIPSVSNDGGQGYSSDYGYLVRTKGGAIYVR